MSESSSSYPSILGANNGLSLVGQNAVLGGITTSNNTLDMSTNGNSMWIKLKKQPANPYHLLLGTSQNILWNFPVPALAIVKDQEDDGENGVFAVWNTDLTNSEPNGFQFLNYSNVSGQILPNIRCASNADMSSGGSAAFNLDMIGKDTGTGPGATGHFSVFYYDYGNYFETPGHQASTLMLNSDFITFNNGSGGDVDSVRFFFIDKHYNVQFGKFTSGSGVTQPPLASFSIADNGNAYGIFQYGASSVNWFAGHTVIGGAISPTSNGNQLQVAGSLSISTVTLPVTPVNGSLETDGTHLYFTIGGVRKTVTLV
jgi:hypothetical protein